MEGLNDPAIIDWDNSPHVIAATALIMSGQPPPHRDDSEHSDETHYQPMDTVLDDFEQRWRTMLALSTDWYWESDREGQVVLLSEGLERAQALHLVGQNIATFGIDQAGSARADYERRLQQHVDFGPFEFRLQSPVPGEGPDSQWLSFCGQAKTDADGAFAGYRGIGRDVTARQSQQERVRLLANRDPLTGLPNRAQFHSALNEAVAESRQCQQPFALALIDLDDFHAVNAAHGNAVGDAFLMRVARRLQGVLSPLDQIARLSGDLFGVLLHDAADAKTLTRMLKALMKTLARPVAVEKQLYHASMSMGVTLFPSDASDAANLLRNADITLHRAKATGRGQFALYRPELRRAAQRRSTLMQEIAEAAHNSESLVLHYQPIVDLPQRSVIGFEALLRWLHPRLGLVSIGAFQQVFENLALGAQIGHQVMELALDQLALWRAQGVVVPKVSLNVTAGDFVIGNFPELLARGLAQRAIPAQSIGIEVTEGTLLRRSAMPVHDGLHQLREMGCEIAFDDFGTGFASLTHLKLPLDRLKIDRSFVIGLDGELEEARKNAAIIRAVVELGHGLGKAITVEGVDSQSQLDQLTAMGCTQFQGYFFAKPMPAQEAPGFLASFQPGPAPSAPAPLLA